MRCSIENEQKLAFSEARNFHLCHKAVERFLSQNAVHSADRSGSRAHKTCMQCMSVLLCVYVWMIHVLSVLVPSDIHSFRVTVYWKRRSVQVSHPKNDLLH